MLSFDQNNSLFREPHQILGKRGGFKMKSMTWSKIRISLNTSVDFRQFLNFSNGNVSCMHCFTRIPKIGLFYVRTVVTELQPILRLKKQKIADYSLKCLVLIKIVRIFVIFIEFWVEELDLK